MARRKDSRHPDSRRYYDWLDRAGDDLICAGLLLKDDNCYNNAAFHCQQCIEKALKAYILFKSSTLVDGHNLTWLCRRAMRYNKNFSIWLDESAHLNKCYIETRYPSDLPFDIDFAAVSAHYSLSIEIYRAICSELDDLLENNRIHPGQRHV